MAFSSPVMISVQLKSTRSILLVYETMLLVRVFLTLSNKYKPMEWNNIPMKCKELDTTDTESGMSNFVGVLFFCLPIPPVSCRLPSCPYVVILFPIEVLLLPCLVPMIFSMVK